MQIIDRYTGKSLSESNLPNDIELGRYTISIGSNFKELTAKTYKVKEGQRIHQELLDDINKDKQESQNNNSLQNLNQFGNDLTKQAREGKLDPVIDALIHEDQKALLAKTDN